MKAPIQPKFSSINDTSNFQKEGKVFEEKEKLNPFYEDHKVSSPTNRRNSSNQMFVEFELARIDLLHQLNQQDAAHLALMK